MVVTRNASKASDNAVRTLGNLHTQFDLNSRIMNFSSQLENQSQLELDRSRNVQQYIKSVNTSHQF